MQPVFLYKSHSLIFIELTLLLIVCSELGFPDSSSYQESACNAEDLGLIPGSGRSPGEGNGNSLQCSCLENSVDRGAWQAIVHRVAESWTRLSNFTGSLVRVSSWGRWVACLGLTLHGGSSSGSHAALGCWCMSARRRERMSQGHHKECRMWSLLLKAFWDPCGPGTTPGELQCGRPRFNPESGRSLGAENGYPLRYSCLENPMTEEPGGLQSERVGHD